MSEQQRAEELAETLRHFSPLIRERGHGMAADRMNEAADRLERLEALERRLPKTADGVPVVPGMRVYHPEDGTYEYPCLASWVEPLLPTRHRQLAQNCYSTERAAHQHQSSEGEGVGDAG